jgi:hypothetical protein
MIPYKSFCTLYIDMLGVLSLHHKHHAIYIDMLGVPSLHHEHGVG